MISISSFQSSDQAKSYYSKENYYLQGGDVGKFGGSLSSLLVNNKLPFQENYFQLLQGINPNTEQKLTKSDKRAGFDVTFSAPKSFSLIIETLRANDKYDEAEQLLNAHRAAVNRTMQEVEKYLKTRIRDEFNNIVKIDTIGGIWASFEHDISRMSEAGEIDPQIHTHNFIFNIVAYTDSSGNVKYGTIENFDVFKNKMYLGQLYRSELAKQLKELGYEIEITDAKQGFFEVKGFTKEQIDAFSNRAREINEHLEEYQQKYKNANEAKLKNIINQDIKKAKKEVDRKQILERNKHRMEELGITLEFVEALKQEQVKEKKQLTPNELLNAAAKALTEHQSVFEKEELLKEALKIGLGDITVDELEEALIESDYVIELEHNFYTTQEILEAEKYVIANIDEKDEQIYQNKAIINSFINSNYSNMTDDQKQMLNGILTSDDKFIVVQGDAGTGKTYSLKALNEFIKKYAVDKYELVGLSFTGKAAAGLENESGIKSSTIHSFLAKELKTDNDNYQQVKKKKILIVDEAGLVGSLQYAQLVKLAKERDYKIVFVGDVKQFAPVAAGNLFKEIQGRTTTIKLSQTLRQKSDYLKQLVSLLKQTRINIMYSALTSHNLLIEGEKEDLINQIVDDYFKSNEDLLIIASKNEDKDLINQLIRTKKTFKDTKTFKVKEAVNAKITDKYLSSFYLLDKDYIIELGGHKFKPVKQLDRHTLIVKNLKTGAEKTINLLDMAHRINVFKIVEKEFGVGDKIIFTKNDNKLGIKNGEIVKIVKIDNDVLVLSNGKRVNLNEYNYIDYGYAITDYKAQGVTADNVAVLADSYLASYNSFYTQLTRAKYNIKIYTDNAEQLFENIQSFIDKKTTLEFRQIKKEKGVKYDAERDVSENIGESISDDEAAAANRRQAEQVRKIRLRFKELIYRAVQRIKQLAYQASKYREVEMER